MKKQNSSTTPA